jgi:DNA-binding transcriptional regulator YiaG
MHSAIKLQLIARLIKVKSPMTKMDLYHWRLELNLTQEDLATHLGVCRQTINVWENGHRRIPYWCDLSSINRKSQRSRGPYDKSIP